MYREFYNSYKEEIQKRCYKKWSNYNVEVKNDIIDDLKSFIPVNSNWKNNGGFRFTKNHKSTNVFNKIHGINQSGVGLQNIQPIRESQNRININANSNINNAINEDGDNKSMIVDLEQNKPQPGKNIHIHISKKK